jgi:hypothetical protein
LLAEGVREVQVLVLSFSAMIFALLRHLVAQVLFIPQLLIADVAELFGFITEGLVFEVLEGGWVGQVTCFKA